MAAAFLGYGAVSAAGDPPAAPASLKAEGHDGYIEIIFTHPNESNIDGWQVQVRAGGTPWSDWYDLPDTSPDSINGFIENTDDDGITGYRYNFRAAGSDWGSWTDASPTVSADGDHEYVTFDGLEADTLYRFKLRAMRGANAGDVGRAKGSTEAAAEGSQ